jgi:hypothetical protein
VDKGTCCKSWWLQVHPSTHSIEKAGYRVLQIVFWEPYVYCGPSFLPSFCKTLGSLSLPGTPWVNHVELGLMQKARGIYCFSALGSSQTQRRGGERPPAPVWPSFYMVSRGQNRASATRHNTIGGTVHPLNWLFFREWGDKDFPCLKVSNGQSCGMCPEPTGPGPFCPVVWEMLISLSLPEGRVFHDLPKVPMLTFSKTIFWGKKKWFEKGSPYVALTRLELSVDQAGLEFTETSASWVLGLKKCHIWFQFLK